MAGTQLFSVSAVDTPRDIPQASRFQAVRAMTAALAGRLTAEDQMVQSSAEASPVKWHLAHSSWFFETFVLREFVPGYRPFDPEYLWLFNSYYKSLGGHPEKKLRASFSRPSLERVLAYRRHVEDGILELLQKSASASAFERIEMGMHHEQQHQELIVTDIKHAFWSNPLQPAYAEAPGSRGKATASGLGARGTGPQWMDYSGGLVEIGHGGEGFAFDNELDRHRVYLAPFRLAARPVTCAEYLAFIEDGGYGRPELWLSDGWDVVQSQGWQAPLYWQAESNATWSVFTLHGPTPLEKLLDTPVCHVSHYEADAYARWAGARLPTEFEWEHVAASVPIAGNFLESGAFHPLKATEPGGEHGPEQLFGDVWEWTQSAYTAYPGYRPATGALGEYNGKFMSGQMVLRGGSTATPVSHMRASYRNFFAPATRWQFCGIRLAADGAAA